MQALTDPLFPASHTAASTGEPALPARTDTPRNPAKPRSERAEAAVGGTARQVQVRAALNDLSDDMFRSLQSHDERRRRPARASVSQEQAVHLRAALAAAARTDAVDEADEDVSDGGFESQSSSRPAEAQHTDDFIRQVDDQRDLLARVLRQVTERCESSEVEVRRLQLALREAEERHARDGARVEQLTSDYDAMKTTYEWMRVRLDDVETAASATAETQARELDEAQTANRSLTAALEEETRRGSALDSELTTARDRLNRQAEQLASLSVAYDTVQQLLTRMMSGVSEAGARLQHLIEHQKSRVEHIDVNAPVKNTLTD